MAKKLICKKEDLREGTIRKFVIDDKEILVARLRGNFFALENKCSHKGGDLSKGELDGFWIKCPVHGATYDLRTGMLVKNINPVLRMFSKASDQKKISLATEGDSVYADL